MSRKTIKEKAIARDFALHPNRRPPVFDPVKFQKNREQEIKEQKNDDYRLKYLLADLYLLSKEDLIKRAIREEALYSEEYFLSQDETIRKIISVHFPNITDVDIKAVKFQNYNRLLDFFKRNRKVSDKTEAAVIKQIAEEIGSMSEPEVKMAVKLCIERGRLEVCAEGSYQLSYRGKMKH